MDSNKITFHVSGFLRDASYTFELQSLLEEYKESFPGAESLTLNLNEVLIGSKSKKESRAFSNEGKDVEINIDEWRIRDKKGKFMEPSDPIAVYKTIRFVLNKAVEEYGEKFSDDTK